MASPPQQGPPPIPTKKTSPVVWIIVGVLGLVAVVGIVVIAGGLFLVNKAKDAAAANPALAAAKLMAMANADVEIVSSDDSNGTVTFRDKKSGKVMTLNFDQIQQGKMIFEEDGKKVVVDSSSGNLNIKNDDGSTVRIGENAATNLPSWLPAYPGSTPTATFSMQGGSDSSAAVSFTTKDPVDKVVKFYEDGFKKAGLTTSSNILNEDGKASGGVVTAESSDDKRNVVVNLVTGDDGVTVGITYSDKK
jgi:predicted peroxiredoxin